MVPHIIYEDKEIIVCEKPQGIPTQSRNITSPDMESLLKNHLRSTQTAKDQSASPYLAVIHRLDQPVGGLMVFAKTPHAAKELNHQLTSSGFGKYYQAVLSHVPGKEADDLEDYLVKDGRTNTSRICSKSTPGAKVARLHYEVLKVSGEHALVSVRLMTGRHHQIRVQMKGIGCPIVGDRKYNPDDTGHESMQLFACHLLFRHPSSGKQMEFHYDPPIAL